MSNYYEEEPTDPLYEDQYGQPYQQPPQQPVPPQRSNAEWATLRKEKKARSDAERERDEARRALAFFQAGIDPADARLGYFVRGYQGEMTPTAIKDAATSAGFLQAPPQGPTPEQQAQLAAQERASQVAAAAQAPENGIDARNQALNEAYAQGGTGAVLAKLTEWGIPIKTD